jgi:hypothetical protein
MTTYIINTEESKNVCPKFSVYLHRREGKGKGGREEIH